MNNSVAILKSKEHLKIDFDENEYIIEFRLNIGKGTSPIRIPVKCMEQIIAILEIGPNVRDEKNIVDIIRSSLTSDIDENGEDIITFRTRYGRGSKVHRIRKNEYEYVIAALKEINKDIPEVIAKYEDIDY